MPSARMSSPARSARVSRGAARLTIPHSPFLCTSFGSRSNTSYKEDKMIGGEAAERAVARALIDVAHYSSLQAIARAHDAAFSSLRRAWIARWKACRA